MLTGESYEAFQSPRGSFGAVVATLLAIVASVAIAQVGLSPRSAPVEIRFCNATPGVLSNLVTYGWRLGDVEPGRCSAYVRVNRGFSTMGVGATLGTKRYEVWPEDHVGDQVLAQGRYTFSIRNTHYGPSSVLIDEVRDPSSARPSAPLARPS